MYVEGLKEITGKNVDSIVYDIYKGNERRYVSYFQSNFRIGKRVHDDTYVIIFDYRDREKGRIDRGVICRHDSGEIYVIYDFCAEYKNVEELSEKEKKCVMEEENIKIALESLNKLADLYDYDRSVLGGVTYSIKRVEYEEKIEACKKVFDNLYDAYWDRQRPYDILNRLSMLESIVKILGLKVDPKKDRF